MDAHPLSPVGRPDDLRPRPTTLRSQGLAEKTFLEVLRTLVDLVLTDDVEYFDSLPEVVDRELGTPLAGLLMALNEGRSIQDVLAAAELVDEVSREVMGELSTELAKLIVDMKEYGVMVRAERGSR